MHRRGRPDHPDRRLAELAARQYGVVAAWQLAPLGLSADAIDHRLRCGRFHHVHVGVYAVGHTVISRHGRWMAAVLAYGPAAVLSHRDAAALWAIRMDSRWSIDVTADRYTRNRRPGIDLHRPRLIQPDECTVHHGIPVTTVARTLIDLAAVVPYHQLQRAWDESVRLGLFDHDELVDVRTRFKRRRGLRQIDALIERTRPLPVRTNSDLELTALELFRDARDLPEPGVNVWIAEADAEVDFVWFPQRLVVEIDGGDFHLTPHQRDTDNARDARLQLAGYKVLRVSDRRLNDDPQGVVDDVRAHLLQSAEGDGRPLVLAEHAH